ncbi:AAA family ATPase [Thermococcus sp. 21S7]|uniref:AAA family ATPase n=1 Tax=Thermococcus sp. 21S7 TaxID=1638221 RepID=UPI001439D7C3|nr:AAA family ATPase [Thermococcus sp. 21S7]NJE60399.1 hypothetical protein [Thermococcus sp. 21S7]
MLTKLIIENYKSIEKAGLEFSKINLLIGPNGSGKSSVLEAYKMLILQSGAPRTKRDFLRVVHNHDTTKEIVIEGMFSQVNVSYIYLSFGIVEETVLPSWNFEGEYEKARKFFHVLDADRNIEARLKGVLATPEDATSWNAHQLFYYTALRTEFQDNIRLIREFYSRYGLNNIRWVPTEREGEYEIIATTPEGVDVNIADAGAGLAALFPIVVALSFYPEGSTIFIEHPEMHLHPKLQYELAEFFLMVSEKRDYQLIIETHSEHLLYGLLNAVAQKRMKPEELTIYSTRKENGKSVFEKMTVHEDGSLEGNISDFLEADINAFLDWLKA